MRGRLRQLFGVLTDDNVGSGPRPEPNSLQDPIATDPGAAMVEEAVKQIRQDHMYTASPRSTTPSTQKTANQKSENSGPKRKLDEANEKAGNSKRRW
jgi:hypothetical protein